MASDSMSLFFSGALLASLGMVQELNAEDPDSFYSVGALSDWFIDDQSAIGANMYFTGPRFAGACASSAPGTACRGTQWRVILIFIGSLWACHSGSGSLFRRSAPVFYFMVYNSFFDYSILDTFVDYSRAGRPSRAALFYSAQLRAFLRSPHMCPPQGWEDNIRGRF